MSAYFVLQLVMHILFGLLGVIASYAYLTHVLQAEPNAIVLKRFSLSALVFFLLSWLTGGLYYLNYYGPRVRAVIRGGSFPWAHSIFMEAKEHVFLLLPFLAVALVAVSWLAAERTAAQPAVKRALALLAGVTTAIGVIVTLSGIIISGAVR